jgi:hypothetical protein
MNPTNKRIPFSITGSTSAEVAVYIPVPFRCTVKSMQACPDADPGDGESLTLLSGSNTVGVLTFGSTINPGATGTFAANATYGDTVLSQDDVLIVKSSTLTAAATFQGYVEIDEFARVDS